MYLRAIAFLHRKGRQYVSSSDLARQLHLKSPQIRKDFSYFGAFGVKGTGYHVETLIARIRRILKLESRQKAALVGAGKLGKALAEYPGFDVYGFDIAAIYDVSPDKIGKRIGSVKVQDVAGLAGLRDSDIRLAILAVPAHAAQRVADSLVGAGIRGILNLAPCYLAVPKRVKVITIDIAMELGILPYYV